MSEQITTVEDLDALPVGIVVRLAGGLVAEKRPTGRWAITAHRGPQDLRLYDLPATVLYRPDAPAPSVSAEQVERAAKGISTPYVWESDDEAWGQRREVYRQRVLDVVAALGIEVTP